MTRTKKPKGKVVWLITREDAAGLYEVVTVLAPQLGHEIVKRLVELLHAQEAYTLDERARFCARPSRQPYRAEYGSKNGIPWTAQIHCGHQPFLFARVVENFHVVEDADGVEHAEWIERHSHSPGLARRAPSQPFPTQARDE